MIMKGFRIIALLSICALLMSACSSSLQKDATTLEKKSWAASDNSVHDVTQLEGISIHLKEEGIVTQHKLVDDIPLIEIYRTDAKLLPVMIFLHEHDGNKEQFVEEAVLYAQSGFFCILFDLKGYGERSLSESTESLESAVQATDDIDLLLEYCRLSPYADAEHFVLYGQSMGGSATWHYAAYGKKTPQAIVACSGACDFTTLADLGSVSNGKGQSPAWTEETYMNFCKVNNPITQIERIAQVPALVYQGMQDHTVLPTSTKELEKLLVSAGATNNFFIYDENGGHNVSPMFLNRILPFLKQYVRTN